MYIKYANIHKPWLVAILLMISVFCCCLNDHFSAINQHYTGPAEKSLRTASFYKLNTLKPRANCKLTELNWNLSSVQLHVNSVYKATELNWSEMPVQFSCTDSTNWTNWTELNCSVSSQLYYTDCTKQKTNCQFSSIHLSSLCKLCKVSSVQISTVHVVRYVRAFTESNRQHQST